MSSFSVVIGIQQGNSSKVQQLAAPPGEYLQNEAEEKDGDDSDQ